MPLLKKYDLYVYIYLYRYSWKEGMANSNWILSHSKYSQKWSYNKFVKGSASQTSMCTQITYKLLSYKFWFTRSGGEPQILHVRQVPQWWWHCSSLVHILNSQVLENFIHPWSVYLRQSLWSGSVEQKIRGWWVSGHR